MRRSLDIVAGALLAAGAILAFREPVMAMVAKWDLSPMYSYGYMVPPISAFLLWSRRDELARRPIAPARFWGGAVIASSLALLVIGKVGTIQLLQQFAFVLAVAGIALFLFGWGRLMVCLPAIGYLLFMVPMWDVVTEPLHWPFQNLSAKIGVAMMQAIGVPVYRDGTLIALPNLLIEVARECSGINYLVAVLALALPLAFLRLHQTWRRVVVVGSALVVAALANSLRVALIGTLVYYDVGSPLHGPFHVLHGLFVAAIGYVVIFIGLHFLQAHDTTPPVVRDSATAPHPAVATGGQWRAGEAFGLASLFWALAMVGVAPQARAVALAQPLEALPRQLVRWTADVPELQADRGQPQLMAAWADADGKMGRRYRSEAGQQATIEVFYFASQRQGREIISSTSADLHRRASRVVIGAGDGPRFEANVLEFTDRSEIVLFWYEVDGRAEADQFAMQLNTMWRALRWGRSNGAAIVIRTAIDPHALVTLQDLAAALQPALAGLWSPAPLP